MIVQPDFPTVRPNLAAAASKDLRRDVFDVSVPVRNGHAAPAAGQRCGVSVSNRTNSACRRAPVFSKRFFQMEF